MRRYKVVPVDQIRFFARLTRDETMYRLDELHRLELIIREARPVLGYYLNSIGYDVLAINALVEQDHIAEFGPLLGVGKEADVYEVLGPNKERLALKFHRLGRTSFRNIRKLRGYLGTRGHMSWLYASRLSAEREFEGLIRVAPLNLPIPKPIAQNRHALLMTFIEGQEIRQFHEFPQPKDLFDEILNIIERVYVDAAMVHADLGEFNILLDENYAPLVIDWPQWVPREHPQAGEFLLRDITNLVTFFRRVHREQFAGVDAETIWTEILDKVDE